MKWYRRDYTPRETDTNFIVRVFMAWLRQIENIWLRQTETNSLRQRGVDPTPI